MSISSVSDGLEGVTVGGDDEDVAGGSRGDDGLEREEFLLLDFVEDGEGIGEATKEIFF